MAHFSGLGFCPQSLAGLRLGTVGEGMFQGMYLPALNLVWLEVEIAEKICLLLLVLPQQSTIDAGIYRDLFFGLLNHTQ